MSLNLLGRLQSAVVWVTATALMLSACQTTQTPETGAGTQVVANTTTQNVGTILIDGSSTVYPISDAVAKEYRKTPDGQNVQVDVKFSGTTGGFRKFCAGETDISDSSRPILQDEMDACVKAGIAFYELPVAFDALTIAVNPQNTWAKDITMAELKKIWEPAAQGKITNWNQVRSSYPDRPLNLFGAGSDSGTFDYFNEVTSGSTKASRTDYTASEDDNVLVQGIANDPNALGYFGFAYYEANLQRLKALAVDRGNGKGAVLPSRQAVEKAQYHPFSRPLFIYVSFKSIRDKPALEKFVHYYLQNAKTASAAVGYIPLPEGAYRITTAQFAKGKIGTVFDGTPQPDVTISELLRKQAVFQAKTDNQSGTP